jgi:DNA-binding transcriptional LysR family regulator
MRYLVALDKHKHFGRAAQACHITQPALSNALRALEDEFGVAIIKRSRTYGGVTHEGEVVLETARRMLREVDLLTQELQSTAESPRGALRLGAVPTAMPLLTVFAAMLRGLHPGLVPTMLALSSPDIEAQLEDMSLDLALGYTERLDAAGGRFRSWPQASERYYFLRRRSDEAGKSAAGESGNTGKTADADRTLRFGSPLTWSEAATFPLCQLTPDMHNRAIIDAALASIGMSSAPAIETNSLLAVTLAVSVGDVCAILPGAMVAAMRGRGELEALPLIEPDIRTPLGFIALVDERPSRAMQAALRLMAAPEWDTALAQHVGAAGI